MAIDGRKEVYQRTSSATTLEGRFLFHLISTNSFESYSVFSYNPNPESLKHFVFQFDKANLDKNQKSDDHPPHPSNDVINGLEVNFYP